MKQWIKNYWQTLRSPATAFSLGFLLLSGFIGGIIFWGGFNTALEATNTEKSGPRCQPLW